MAQLFDRDIKTIGKHIGNALREEAESSTVANFATVQTEGNREVVRNIECNKFGLQVVGGIRKLPYAFTEQGIYMLMTVLRSDLCFQFNDDETKELVTICDRFSPFTTRMWPSGHSFWAAAMRTVFRVCCVFSFLR